MNDNSLKKFMIFFLIFIVVSLAVNYFVNEQTANFWSFRSIGISILKAFIFSLVFYFIVFRKNRRND